ncbi:hypothetical protein [Arenivirga flava]|nr:hypothetical protein [Arenivirga flava]
MRTMRTAAALLLAAPLLSGCTAGETCYDWVVYDSVERMHADASLVVAAGRIEPAGTTTWSGVQANRYDVSGSPVLADGSIQEIGMQVQVLSTPETCSGGTYPDGDPMLGAQQVRLYLSEDEDGTLRTLTPHQGVGGP